MSKRDRDAEDADEPVAMKRQRSLVKAFKEEWDLSLLPEEWAHVFDFLEPASRERLAKVNSQLKTVSRKKRRATTPAALEEYYKGLIDLVFRDPQTGEKTAFHKYVALLEQLLDNPDDMDVFQGVDRAALVRYRAHFFYQSMYAFGLLLQVRQNVDVVAALVPYDLVEKGDKAPYYHDARRWLRPILMPDNSWERYSIKEILEDRDNKAPLVRPELRDSYETSGFLDLAIDRRWLGQDRKSALTLLRTGVLTSSSLGLCSDIQSLSTLIAEYRFSHPNYRQLAPAFICSLPILRAYENATGHRYHLTHMDYRIATAVYHGPWIDARGDTLHHFGGAPESVLSELQKATVRDALGVDAVLVQQPSAADAKTLLATIVSRPRMAPRGHYLVGHYIDCRYTSADGKIEFSVAYGLVGDDNSDVGVSYQMALTILRLPPLGYRPFGTEIYPVPHDASITDFYFDIDDGAEDAADWASGRFNAHRLFADGRDADFDWTTVVAKTLDVLRSVDAVSGATLANDPRAKKILRETLAQLFTFTVAQPADARTPWVHYTCAACAAPAQHIRADGSEAFCARCVPFS